MDAWRNASYGSPRSANAANVKVQPCASSCCCDAYGDAAAQPACGKKDELKPAANDRQGRRSQAHGGAADAGAAQPAPTTCRRSKPRPAARRASCRTFATARRCGRMRLNELEQIAIFMRTYTANATGKLRKTDDEFIDLHRARRRTASPRRSRTGTTSCISRSNMRDAEQRSSAYESHAGRPSASGGSCRRLGETSSDR